MKKNKVKKQLRKIATRDAMEKRKNGKALDPFMLMLLSNKSRNPVNTDYNNYDDDGEFNYGEQ